MSRTPTTKQIKDLLRRFFVCELGGISVEYMVMGVFVAAVTVVGAMVMGVVHNHSLDLLSKTVTNQSTEMTVMENGHFKRFTLPDYIEDSEEYLCGFTGQPSGMGGKEQDFAPYLGD